jgi:hypothetical protein
MHGTLVGFGQCQAEVHMEQSGGAPQALPPFVTPYTACQAFAYKGLPDFCAVQHSVIPIFRL